MLIFNCRKSYLGNFLFWSIKALRELNEEHNIAGGGGGYTESLADSPILVYVQTLHNDCLHIENVHLLFCTHFKIFTCGALLKAGLVVGPLCPFV